MKTLLNDMKEYIEHMEEFRAAEYGGGEDFDEIDKKKIPNIYYQVLTKLKECE